MGELYKVTMSAASHNSVPILTLRFRLLQLCIRIYWTGTDCICHEGTMVVWLFSYVLTTSKVVTGGGPTCDSAHTLLLHSAPSLWDKGDSSVTVTARNNPERLPREGKASILKSSVWRSQGSNPGGLESSIIENWRGCSTHSTIPAGPRLSGLKWLFI